MKRIILPLTTLLLLTVLWLMTSCQPVTRPSSTMTPAPVTATSTEADIFTPTAFPNLTPTKTAKAPSMHLAGTFGVGWFSDIVRTQDGKRIFVVVNGRELRWYDAKTLEQEGSVTFREDSNFSWGQNEILFGPDPNLVVVVMARYDLFVVDLKNQNAVATLHATPMDAAGEGRFSGVQFSPDAHLLFFRLATVFNGFSIDNIGALDIQQNQALVPYWKTDYPSTVTDPAISPDGRWLAVGYDDDVQIQDIKTRKTVQSIKTGNSKITDVMFNKDGSQLASLDKESILTIWESKTGKNLGSFSVKDEERYIVKLVFSDDGRQVLLTFSDDVVITLDLYLKTRKISTLTPTPGIDPFAMILHHQGYYQSTFSSTTNAILSISPDGKTLAVGEGFGSLTILLWDIETQKLVRVLENPYQVNPLNEIKFDPTGKTLVGLTGYETLLWNINTTTQPNVGKRLGSVDKDYESRQGLSFSPDGKRFAFGHDNHVEIWDVETSQLVKTLKLKTQDATKTQFSADGQSIYVGGAGRVQVWNIEKGQLMQSIDLPSEGDVSMMALDYPYVVLLRLSDRTYQRYLAEIWNLETKTLKKTDEGYYSSAILRKDKDLLFLKDDPSGTVSRFFILKAETGKYLYTSDLAGYDTYYNIDTLETSNFIATISSGWVVKLWNIDELFDYAQKKAIPSTATPTHSP